MKRTAAAAALSCLAAATAPSHAAELRPSVSLGYAHVGESHASFSGALRLHLTPWLFVHAEYLALAADGHTDHGPTFQAGVSGRKATGLRPYLAVGAGPIDGFAGDDGIAYAALGAAWPFGAKGLFVQPEVRVGLLGETAFTQVAFALGFSRPRPGGR